ncbi:hypothetical protein ABPG75_006502 [Micractinium tetrahymenae]
MAAQQRDDNDPLWPVYHQAFDDPASLAAQQQASAYYIARDSSLLEARNKTRLRAQVTARLLLRKATAPHATPRALLLEQAEAVPGLPAFQDGQPLPEGSWEHPKRSDGTTSEAAHEP